MILHPKWSQEILAQIDQGTWSLLSLLASVLYIKSNKLSDIGIFYLILTFVYCNLSIIKSFFLFPVISDSVQKKEVNIQNFTKKIFQPLKKILVLEMFLLSIILLGIRNDTRQVIDFIILFLALTMRDISRSINIYFNKYVENVLQNILAMLIIFCLHFLAATLITIPESWAIGIVVSHFFFTIGGMRVQSFSIEPKLHQPLDKIQEKLLRLDSLATQLISFFTMIIFTSLDSTLIGKFSVMYTCIASIGVTVGSGFTGKLNLQYLRERTSERKIFQRYLVSIIIILVNLWIVIMFDFLPLFLVGDKWLDSFNVLVPAFLLYTTVLLNQFYAFPLLVSSKNLIFLAFRIVSFITISVVPYLFILVYSVNVAIIVQTILLFVLFLSVRILLWHR